MKRKTLHLPGKYAVKAVRSELVPYYWDFVLPYVQDALEHAHGEMDAVDVYNYLCAERMFLFIASNGLICGACVCEVAQYPRKKAIRVVTLGGRDFDSWKQLLQRELFDWKEKVFASEIEAYIRKGLVPSLEELGYKQVYIGMAFDGKGKRD